jgi:hypothetical protein
LDPQTQFTGFTFLHIVFIVDISYRSFSEKSNGKDAFAEKKFQIPTLNFVGDLTKINFILLEILGILHPIFPISLSLLLLNQPNLSGNLVEGFLVFFVHRGNRLPQDLGKVNGKSEKITSFQDFTE